MDESFFLFMGHQFAKSVSPVATFLTFILLLEYERFFPQNLLRSFCRSSAIFDSFGSVEKTLQSLSVNVLFDASINVQQFLSLVPFLPCSPWARIRSTPPRTSASSGSPSRSSAAGSGVIEDRYEIQGRNLEVCSLKIKGGPSGQTVRLG